MIRALEKRKKKDRPTVSDEEFEAARDMLASVTANDPNVRLV